MQRLWPSQKSCGAILQVMRHPQEYTKTKADEKLEAAESFVAWAYFLVALAWYAFVGIVGIALLWKLVVFAFN